MSSTAVRRVIVWCVSVTLPVCAHPAAAQPALITKQDGGRTITATVLKPGDVIVSTTSALLSAIIRKRSGAAVSHAMLYTRTEGGIPLIVEAVGSGVAERPLDTALRGATVAAVFRHPRLRDVDAANLVGFARTQMGASYNKWGVIAHPLVGIFGDVCSRWPSARRADCANRNNWEVQVSADATRNEFFCSELVLEAYNQVNLRLTTASPKWSTPGDIPSLSWVDELEYIGHLR